MKDDFDYVKMAEAARARAGRDGITVSDREYWLSRARDFDTIAAGEKSVSKHFFRVIISAVILVVVLVILHHL